MADFLKDGDKEQIEKHGLTVAEIKRQVVLLQNSQPVKLLAPAVVGYGIQRLSDEEQVALVEVFAQISDRSLTKFVPASGAASRMFKHLFAEKNDLRDLFEKEWEKMPFAKALKSNMANPNSDKEAVETLLGEGFDYANKPKGIIPFHKYGSEVRDAFQEQVAEFVHYQLQEGNAIHFTINPAFRTEIEASVNQANAALKYPIAYSAQMPETDTVAIESDGKLLRDEAGKIVFRPGGHGALLTNLSQCKSDYVVMKNIDNVAKQSMHEELGYWKRLLIAKLHQIKTKADDSLRNSDANQSWEEHAEWIKNTFGHTVEANRAAIIAFLDRPMRVVGMVKNEGEPGGGPFWIAQNGKEALQIVEKAEVNMEDKGQAALVANATHFNPVDLVCAFQRYTGEGYPLHEFADASRSFVAEKSMGEKQITVLEHPGLWNGAMAFWNTIFVEVPLSTFNPVKTVNDLLREAHR